MHKTLLYSIIAFITTVFIALPEKNQPIGKRHQDIIAHQLVTFNIWEQNGFWNYWGGLILTYPNPGDLDVQSDPIQSGKNHKGEYFYLSYPPFNFHSTYFILKVLGLPVDDFSIRWIASFFLFLNILGFFFLFKEKELFPILLYLFLPNVLWFHHNVWFVDIQVITFILWAMYFSYTSINLFLITLFLACFTEWWGFLFGFFLLLYIKLIEWKKWKPIENFPIGKLLIHQKKYQFLSLLFMGLAFLLFASINVINVGLDEVWNGLYHRFMSRTGLKVTVNDYFSRFEMKTYIFILWYYLRNYLFVFILILVFGYFTFIKNKRLIFQYLYSLSPLWFSIFLHHFILINWTAAHDFSVLKFSIVIPFLIYFILEQSSAKLKYLMKIGVVLAIPIQLHFYYKHKNVDRNTEYIKIAECINKSYHKNEVAKANYYNKPLPYLWWKSQRIVLRDSTDAKCK